MEQIIVIDCNALGWIDQLHKKVNDWVKSVLSTRAKPSLRGAITSNKLHQIGVDLRQQNDGLDWRYELWQRGEMLGCLECLRKDDPDENSIVVEIKKPY